MSMEKEPVEPSEQQISALEILTELMKRISNLSSLDGAASFRRFHSRAIGRLRDISPREAEEFARLKVPNLIIRNPNEKKGHRLEKLKVDWHAFIANLASVISFHPEEVFGVDERVPNTSFGLMKFENLHPRILEVAANLWRDGHYRQAILDTYIALVSAVKEKAGRTDLDNTPLMQTVFSANSPILKVSDDEDEQKGFMWLFSGAVMGIRNPKAHRLVAQEDPQRAFEWLSFASVLFRVLDECKVVERRGGK